MKVSDRNTQGVRLGWLRTIATALAILSVYYAGYAIWVAYSDPLGVDFISFWAAAQLVIDGQPALAYDIPSHRAVEAAAATLKGLMPFPYPPPFLFLVTPFGLVPFWVALLCWTALVGSLYLFAARRLAPLPYSLAHPPVIPNLLIGQNGLLTTAMFLFAASLLERRPFVAGFVIGLFVIKPQLALLFPVALLASREWRAIAGATLCASALLLSAWAAFGLETYSGFLAIAPRYIEILRESQLPWNELASTFAFLRHVGVAQSPALAAHAVVALIAAVVTWKSWAAGHPQRVGILAAAVVLVPPYLFTYDSVLIIVPICALLQQQRSRVAVFVWLCCLLPILKYAGYYPGPNPIPIGALACLWTLYRPTQEGRVEATTQASGAA